MDIHDFNIRIFTEQLSKYRDIYIHASSVEVIIISQYSYQGRLAIKYFIDVSNQKS